MTGERGRRGCFAVRLRGDAGQVGGIEVLPLGVLVFVVGGLLLANAWAVVDAKLAAETAAHAAVRAAVEADTAEDALRAARREATAVIDGLGRDPRKISVLVTTDAAFGRCARLTATVRTWVPAIGLPWIGGFGERFEISASAVEVVDPLRDTLSGEASCVG